MGFIETNIIERIRRTFPGGKALTDDCGEIPLPCPGEKMLVTTDLMESGQHFAMDWHPPEMLARKLLMVNLSDLDASGARPLGFTLTLALGSDLDELWLGAFLDALAEESHRLGLCVIGGDTVGRSSGLGLGITAFGAARRWLRRDTLQTGDRVYVDQMPGASLRGLKKLESGLRWDPVHPDPDLAWHLDPKPNLGLGPRLASMDEVHACIDLSDGISKDLRMMADGSAKSILLWNGLDQDALRGGEDYARCFASSLDRETLEARLNMPLFCIGEVLDRQETAIFHYDGIRRSPLLDLSFNHFQQA